MDKMKKKLIIFTVVFLLLFILLYPPIITPDDYYIVSKEKRKEIVKQLSEGKCFTGGPFYLMHTYSDKFHDEEASECWAKFIDRCRYNKENNLTLKLPITCPTY